MDTLRKLFRRPVPPGRAYQERLEREYALIHQHGFAPVFTQVRDILDLSEDIPHITRGSCGSSLICYLLGISDYDPLEHDFALSRFMHLLRPDLPDIDVDFPHHRRDDVIERVHRKYPGRVARISNHVKYQERSAVRQALRDAGVKAFIPKYFDVEALAGEKTQWVLQRAKELVGTVKNQSLHCGGIVIFDGPVPEELKLNERQIKLDKDEVESARLMKIDLLCNRGMSQHLEISKRALADYPEEDDLTAKIFQTGETWGVTFGESPAQRKLFVESQPRRRSDIILALALIRPLPSADGRKAKVVEQWQRERHTHGHLVYDDDGIRYIQDLLLCPEYEAEVYRKAFAKDNKEKIAEFAARISHRPDQYRILHELSYFQLYSFCKAHATAYGYLVWALAYEKARQPQNFWISALNHAASQYRPWVHFQEAKRAGIVFTNFGRGPWTLEETRASCLLPDDLTDGWAQYKRRSYWTSNRFMPGMYLREEGSKVKFKGLIATGRHHTVYGREITFVTLGVASCQYVELIFDQIIEYDRFDGYEGEGTWQGDSVKVNRFTGWRV